MFGLFLFLLGCLRATGHALAGNPTTLTVGGTDVLNGGYWTTNADGTLTPDGASADNYNVYYDGNGTLTLKDATINGTDIIGHVGAGIYAEGDLTIVLEGTSTVTGVQDPNGESQSIRVSGNLRSGSKRRIPEHPCVWEPDHPRRRQPDRAGRWDKLRQQLWCLCHWIIHPAKRQRHRHRRRR